MKTLIAALLFSLAACATDNTPSTISRDPHAEPPPASCTQACRVALDACGSTADDRELVANCATPCSFSAEEARCLAALSCGDDTSTCF